MYVISQEKRTTQNGALNSDEDVLRRVKVMRMVNTEEAVRPSEYKRIENQEENEWKEKECTDSISELKK